MRYAIIIILICWEIVGYGQNLVHNGDFSTYEWCPNDLGQIHIVEGWYQAKGSPDYYHACSNPPDDSLPSYISVSVPRNYSGYQSAKSDSGYMAVATYTPVLPNASECIQTEFASRMEAGREYYFRMYVSLADSSNFAVAELGAYFSPVRVTGLSSVTNWPPFEAHIINPSGNLLDDKEEWMEISGTYVAQGNEQWLVIGRFVHDNELTVERVADNPGIPWSREHAYYYIDDVLVMPYDEWVGVEEAKSGSYSIYPNPSSGSFTVSFPKQDGVMTVKVTDLSGRVCSMDQVSGGSGMALLSPNLNDGIYLLALYDLEGTRLWTSRFVLIPLE